MEHHETSGGRLTSLQAENDSISFSAGRQAHYQAALPQDCTFLSISGGALLVSRSHAVFCRIPQGELGAVRAAMRGEVPLVALSRALLDDLDRHGFFGPPRPAAPDPPTVQLQLTNACNLACS